MFTACEGHRVGEELKCRLSNDDNKSSLVPVPSADATPKVYLIGKYAKESVGFKVYGGKVYKTSQSTQDKQKQHDRKYNSVEVFRDKNNALNVANVVHI